MHFSQFGTLKKIVSELMIRKKAGLSLLFVMFFLAGCGKIISYYTNPFMEDLTSSFLQQRDIVLAEQGTPAFLLILDGMIKHKPGNKDLLLSGAKAYSAYSSAFVGEDDIERNKILSDKAKEYAFRAFTIQNKKFAEAKDRPHSEFVTYLPYFKEKDVPYLYYVSTSWAGWIQAHSESWDAIADLPKVQSLTERLIELDETFNYGAAHTFMGVLLTIRPESMGGRPEKAARHFDRAIEIGQGRFLPSYVMYAIRYAKPAYKEKLFYELLERVLASPVDEVPELTLINSMARKEAGDMIDEARKEEYFK